MPTSTSLHPPDESMTLPERGALLHFIGIGGIGVSAVARLALGQGYRIRGSDVRRSALTDTMARLGADVRIGHNAAHLDGVDAVVFSTAIPETNVELAAARAGGVPLLHRSELLAAFVDATESIGVTGTHGKGTISSMIAHILVEDGQDPGWIIGGIPMNYGRNAEGGAGRLLVAEVDESDGSHCNVRPRTLVCNFLEADHLNYYRDLDHIIETMARAISDNPRLESVWVNGDCPGNRRLATLVSRPLGTYGVETDCDVRGSLRESGPEAIRFEVTAHGESLGEFRLQIPGTYNVVNALAAIAVSRELGVAPDVQRRALATYRGLENRFTVRRAGGRTIVKDYNSHPTAMRKVLDFGREMGGRRIISIFKPYRYTLIHYLQDEYATAFEGSEEVLITKMYAADEDPIPGVDTAFFVRLLEQAGQRVRHLHDENEIVPWLAENTGEGDLVFFFGGDDFFRMADAWADALDASNP
ncbi:MAG: UDP-N-acetylmuramate--L-alanine ligase [Deltaproteobacteria bacterium]|nr:MAG: UDP-N-acetylmuramate--L-alanine ligase [Deltaproteobacteria bacterium]